MCLLNATSILLACRVGQTPPLKLSRERIEALMEREGFPSVSAFAEAVKINRTQLYQMWDTDTPTLANVGKIAKKLRASIGELVEEEPIRALDVAERPEYRPMLEMLEAVTPDDRDQFVTFITWTLKKILLSDDGRESAPARTPLITKVQQGVDKPARPPFRASPVEPVKKQGVAHAPRRKRRGTGRGNRRPNR